MRHLAETCLFLLLAAICLAIFLAHPSAPQSQSEEDELLERIRTHPWWEPEPGPEVFFDHHWDETMIEQACHMEGELAYIMNGVNRNAYNPHEQWKAWYLEPDVKGKTFEEFIAFFSHAYPRGCFILNIGPLPPAGCRDRLLVLRAIYTGLEERQHAN
jgi:hypothetical protein